MTKSISKDSDSTVKEVSWQFLYNIIMILRLELYRTNYRVIRTVAINDRKISSSHNRF